MDANLLIFYIFIFLFGLCIGSFLNVVIYRLEKEKKLSGRSFCPHCKHTLSWKDLVPVFSFLWLMGSCRYCSKKISWQYLVVEIATGLVFLIIFSLQYFNFTVLNLINIAFLWYIWTALIVIFVYDLKHYIIPDKILFPAIIITFSYQLVFNFSLLKHNLIWSGLGAAAFFLVIYLVSRGNWMGFGDVKLAILLGLLLGFPNILLGMFLAFLFGAIIGLGLMIKNKKDLKSQVPFAPFLIVGTFIAMFFGQAIIYWYMNFLILQ